MLQIKIPGADFSGSTLPKFRRLVAGFDAANLDALYLCEDGAVGGAITALQDASGNGRHLSFYAGSGTVVRTAAGVSSADVATAFACAPGLSMARSCTVFGVVRSNRAYIAGTNQGRPVWLGRRESFPASLTLNNPPTNPGFNLITDLTGSSSVKNLIQLQSLDPRPWGDPSSTVKQFSGPGEAAGGFDGDEYVSWALSIDVTAETVAFRSGLDPSKTTYALNHEDAVIDSIVAAGFETVFGCWRYYDTNTHGTVSLFGSYSRAMDYAELGTLIDNAKSFVSARGVTVY